MLLLVTCAILFVLYSVLILYYTISWKAAPVFVPEEKKPVTTISVIIPARNEEKNIRALLESLEKQSYPRHLYEVIVVDDHSTDQTAAVVYAFARSNIFLLRLKEDKINSYKKKAIEAGIAAARNELVVTTDADCMVPETWLHTIAAFYEEKKPVFIAAPVKIESRRKGVVEFFQSLDFAVLQGITGASVYKQVHSMCNGANLAYTKTAFEAVNGFSGIDAVASGDDMLLMHKIAQRYPGQTAYLKSSAAIVSTAAMYSWRDFFNQRIRWASKADKYDDKRITLVLALVYLFNLSFLVLLIAGFFNPLYWWAFLVLLLAKTVLEFPFIMAVTSFFKQSNLPYWFLFFQPLHIAYMLIAGWLGKFGSYEWKGRRVK